MLRGIQAVQPLLVGGSRYEEPALWGCALCWRVLKDPGLPRGRFVVGFGQPSPCLSQFFGILAGAEAPIDLRALSPGAFNQA